MSDQHNARVMGCAGDPVIATPNLDLLAEQGALLTQLYSPSPLCEPARMAFMTGMLPSHAGVMTNSQILSSARPTLAHAAGAAGYVSYLSGRLHALGPDQLLGFADRAVGDHGPNYPGGRESPNTVLDGTAGPGFVSLEKSGVGRNRYQVRDEFAAEAAVSFIERHAIEQAATGERRPFFLSVGFMLPHQPYVATGSDFERYAGQVPPPRVAAPAEPDSHPFLVWWREATGLNGPVPEHVVERARTAYWAMVDRMDQLIGLILAALDRRDLNNTMIIYTSDHGDHVGEHGLWWKQTFYDAASRVPGIVRWPGVVPAGSICERVASLLDINASIIDALSAPNLPRSTGRSLLPVLTGDASWDDVAIAEYCIDSGHYVGIELPDGSYQRMVRKGRFKYVDFGDQEPQLFDMKDDPEETHDLSTNPAHRDVEAELRGIARYDWDPSLVRAETRLCAEEMEIFNEWTRRVQPEDRDRWEIDPRYDALDE
jgi:choline-sulfatase